MCNQRSGSEDPQCLSPQCVGLCMYRECCTLPWHKVSHSPGAKCSEGRYQTTGPDGDDEIYLPPRGLGRFLFNRRHLENASSTYSARSNAEDHTALTGWLCHSLQSVMQVPDWHVREGVMVNKEGLWVFKTELWSDSARTEKRVCFDMV